MEMTASSCKLRANAPEGRKAISYQEFGEVPFVDALTVRHPETGDITIFAINRLTKALPLVLPPDQRLSGHVTLTDADPNAVNSLENPERVMPGAAKIPGTLQPLSWNVLHLASLILLLFFLTNTSLAAPAPAFVANDRWVAIGDSITQDTAYARYVDLFQVIRRPDQPVTYLNAGVSGDSAAGALRRFDWDILPADGPAPTVATIMLGMNDCGRDLYAPGSPDDALAQKKRHDWLDAYAKAMRTLVERLEASGVRVILITPSPYDDTSAMDKPNLPGANTALAACADIARALAAERDLAVIDLNGPLTAYNQRRQKADPTFTMIGGDRVHPGVLRWPITSCGPSTPSALSSVCISTLPPPKFVLLTARRSATWQLMPRAD